MVVPTVGSRHQPLLQQQQQGVLETASGQQPRLQGVSPVAGPMQMSQMGSLVHHQAGEFYH